MGGMFLIGVGIYKTLSDYSSDMNKAAGAQLQGEYEAGVDRRNADLADRQAANVLAAGSQAEARSRLNTQLEIGATRASYAGQGVDTNTGSAVETQATEAGLGELDALTIRNNAANEAYGYSVTAASDRQAAKLAEYSGANAAAGYRNAATGTLLTGAVNTYGLFSQYAGQWQRDAEQEGNPDTRTSPYRPPPRPRGGF